MHSICSITESEQTIAIIVCVCVYVCKYDSVVPHLGAQPQYRLRTILISPGVCLMTSQLSIAETFYATRQRCVPCTRSEVIDVCIKSSRLMCMPVCSRWSPCQAHTHARTLRSTQRTQLSADSEVDGRRAGVRANKLADGWTFSVIG